MKINFLNIYLEHLLFSKSKIQDNDISDLPSLGFNYEKVYGVCCENVIGYVGIPVGVVGPLKLDGSEIYIPMATTEGCLVASTHRGCKAIYLSSGINSAILGIGMTRAPVLKASNINEAILLKQWIDNPINFQKILDTFNSTSRYAHLVSVIFFFSSFIYFNR